MQPIHAYLLTIPHLQVSVWRGDRIAAGTGRLMASLAASCGLSVL